MRRGTQKSHYLPQTAASLRSRLLPWRRRGATFIVAGLAAGMAYGVIFGHNGLTAFAKKREEEDSLRVQMQQLRNENDRLQGHVERLQKDPGAIEHQAREDLHYTRAGEVIYTLPESVSSVVSATTKK